MEGNTNTILMSVLVNSSKNNLSRWIKIYKLYFLFFLFWVYHVNQWY